ncbi:MAG: biotin--[acetyl-CoA-carboxylase] ligase [Alphaproteobacteria bacterium]|nr:biotin--[acetyl-CoA-carboxylase] ligase [Alphaproteobacteria bacterium]
MSAFFRPHFHRQIDSTNSEARRLAATDAAEGALVVAEEQTAGRGSRGRSWSSPAGNLYLSLLLRPDCAPAAAGQLSFVAALALADAVEAWLPQGPRPRLKWPNDVLVDGRKLAGILLESAMHAGRVDWVAVGIGVNLASHPEGATWPATSLAALGARIEPAAALATLARALEARYRQWRAEGFAPIRADWLARTLGQGETVTVALGREQVTGRFDDVDGEGALVLALPDGRRRRIASGDVFFARAA